MNKNKSDRLTYRAYGEKENIMKMYRMKIRVTEKTLVKAVQGAVITIEIPALDAAKAQWKAFKLFAEDVQADHDCGGLDFIEIAEI